MKPAKTEITNIDSAMIVECVNSVESRQKILLIDEYVSSLYKDLTTELSNIKDSHLITVPRGETAKSFSNFELYLEKILGLGINRNTHLIAIGGGATSDFVGFLAASLLRGIEWSVIPTTLLSMIDASIGGKVAINSNYGKNLIGAFHKPQNIWVCTDFLSTLEQEELNSGYGELIKYGFLSKEIFNKINSGNKIDEIIRSCGRFKEELTIRDFKELGERKNLNIGHTIGHAIEKHLKLPHGISVYHGMKLEAHLTNNSTFIIDSIASLSKKLDLHIPALIFKKNDIEPLLDYCFKDKKLVSKKELEFLIPQKIEDIKSLILSKEELRDLLIKTGLFS
jgi:3-dehydroquinate synthetase